MRIYLRRREFIAGLGGAAAAWPLAVGAQQRALPVIGYLSGRSADADASMLVSVRRGLADLGYAEGRNVGIEYRFADGRYDRLSAQLTDLTQRKVGVIVFPGVVPIEELVQQVRASPIPIVMTYGADPRNRPAQALPESICVAEYAPYSVLFPRAAMVVHQGGVGTTAQCLQAGKPMLIMPYSHDQPDNARRMRRLKVARVIKRGDYTPLRVARKIQSILEEPKFARRAQSVARRLANEDGVRAACDALEELWTKTRR